MKLRELLLSDELMLPRARLLNVSLPDQLREMYSTFFASLQNLDGTAAEAPFVVAALPTSKAAAEQLINSVSAYLNGFPHSAFERFKDAMGKLKPHLVQLKAPNNQLRDLFRMRVINSLALKSRYEIFHLPFEYRHLVKTQRYSISGWPSLYLGASLLVCWEEMGRPAFDSVYVSSFDAESSVSVLDFGYTPRVFGELHEPLHRYEPSFFTEQQVGSYIACWPLLAACAVEVGHRGASFIEEYIIPQQLLQWVRANESDLDGIRYFSTRILQTSSAPDLAINYVFPVKTEASRGLCTVLASKFRLTLPTPWSLAQGIEIKTMSPLRSGKPYLFSPEFALMYDDTEFRRIEIKISSLPKLKI